MKNEHAGAIKGLSIAVVVLSAIGIIGAILIMVFSGLLSAVLLENGPEIAYHLEFNDNGTITGGGTAFDGEDAFFLSMLMMLVGGGVAIWALICCIVALIAGIFGIMHAANPPKLGFVMGWAIAGAEMCIRDRATGAVVVSQGDTILLTTAVVSKERRDLDFFPLTVDFIEKMYAVGRIPGGYLKREARPSEKGTLTARLVDRPIRPSFPDGMRNDVHIVITTLSCDQVNQPDVISIMGASAALMVGGVPIEGPVAGVRIARAKAEDGSIDYIVNPTFEEAEASDLNLTVAGTKEYISMVEAGADEVCEADMIAALEFAQEAIGAFCDEQQKFLDKCTIEPKTYELDQPIPEVVDKVDGYYAAMEAALKDADKQSRIAKVEELKDEIKASFTDEERAMWGREIAAACKALEKRAMRTMIIETGERVDGRANDEIRPLYIKPHYLPRAHGSGLFQRGQTQVLSVVTLGMLNEWQRLDTIDPAEGKRYIHQYNFPPYCTGRCV